MALTASDIASMTRCAHRVYLDRFGKPEERVPYPEFLQILWESGRLHEDEVGEPILDSERNPIEVGILGIPPARIHIV